METRRLGNTDLDLTPIGFGTWAIGGGDWSMGWGPQEEKDSIGSILEGLEAGINWIDTAHAYGFGLSEEVVGKALREWGQPVIVATKCGVLSNADKSPRRFASREIILEEVESSLRRLQVETIDLYQLHWPEPDENIEDAWQTLLDLQAQLLLVAYASYLAQADEVMIASTLVFWEAVREAVSVSGGRT